MLAWSVRVCSLAVVVGLSVPLYQFPGAISDVGRAVSGRSWLLAWVIVIVLSRAFLSALVHLVFASHRLFASCCGEVVGLFLRPVCLVGEAVRRRVWLLACPCSCGAAVRAMSSVSFRSASRLLATMSGEAGRRASRLACLLGGGDGVYVRGVPCLSRLPCDCLPHAGRCVAVR